ncbi:hypothetical protein E2C01_063213 [Portunus trituberculatus]|uniref:Uncharacterized protein n=1 Tax=Portunus trituberculatus TaxID=210409 RepID=A0A5B7H9W4_PORTR|nr:hypothetical protein [Portunus trituberculatus]
MEIAAASNTLPSRLMRHLMRREAQVYWRGIPHGTLDLWPQTVHVLTQVLLLWLCYYVNSILVVVVVVVVVV